MASLEQRRKDLEKKKADFESKKKGWLSDIKFQTEAIEGFLGKIERNPFSLDTRDRRNLRYKNDFTGDLEHYLKKMKEIFEEASDEESSLIMEEEDLEDEESEKRAKISLADIIRDTINEIEKCS